MTGGSISGLRRRNRDMVLSTIASKGPLSRTNIAQLTGLTGAAVSRITRELIEVGLVVEGAAIPLKGRVGRRNIHLELGANGAFVLGISLTANVRSVSIGNSKGEIIARRNIDDLELDDPAKVIARLSKAARQLIKSAKVDKARLIGCGMSVAGIVDSESGELIMSEPLGWGNVSLGSALSGELGLPVRVEGRAVALLMAEQWNGAARGKNNVVLINNGLWLGGAIALDGSILRGQHNMIGQIPHMRVGGDETQCTCGRLGCLNVVASGVTVVEALEHIQLPDGRRQLEAGDRLHALSELQGPEFAEVSQAFKSAGRHMGNAVDSFFEMLDPELVLLAGAAGRHPEYIAGIRETLARLRPGETDWPVMASKVTSDQSAVWLALEAFVYSQDLDIEQLKVA